MLRELSVENFAIIDKLHLELAPGFTVLTGETGAGKSIIIEALGAALGERLGAEVIRPGEQSARVETVFDAADAPRALALLDESGIDRDGDLVIVTRVLGADRSRYWINGRSATQALVQDVTQYLVDIHGQHEHQVLIHDRVHLRFLDEFGGSDLREAAGRYRELWDRLQDVLRQLTELCQAERDRAQREDLLRFQVREICEAGLHPGEEEELREERSRLQNSERITEAVASARRALAGDGRPGATDLLGQAARDLQSAAQYDSRLAELARQVEQAAINAAEALRSLDDHAELLEFEPQRLEEVESRLVEIQRLKRKYGDTVEEILAHLKRAQTELSSLENSQERAEELEQEVQALRAQAGEAAEELSRQRQKHARRLTEVVRRELGNLGMGQAAFKVDFQRQEDASGLPLSDGRTYAAGPEGVERVRFLFDAAGGDDPRPLSQVASGGELSRLMLVFKTVCARGADIPTLVFDEVDVGIGGLTAHAVGRKLQQLGQKAQVLCVTHLPQLASRAAQHFTVDRHISRKRATVVVRLLQDEERIEELARMLGGRRDQESARKHAEQLLAEAEGERRAAGERAG